MRWSIAEAQALADAAGRGQDVKAEIKINLADGPKAGFPDVRPPRGECLFDYYLRTIAQDVNAIPHEANAHVFPDPKDDRRCDISFLPIPLVIEIHGGVHQVVRGEDGEHYANVGKMEKDAQKVNDYQFHGLMVLIFTTSQLERDPYPAMEQVRRALRMLEEKCVPWYTLREETI